MHFYAFHGVYEAEQILGTNFIVDIHIEVADPDNGWIDHIRNTINYETVYQIVKQEMGQPKNLIESVLQGISEKLMTQFSNMHALRIVLHKRNPPLGTKIDSARIETSQKFLSECPECNHKFILYHKNACFENNPNIHPATKETLLKQYNAKCLCKKCLSRYTN